MMVSRGHLKKTSYSLFFGAFSTTTIQAWRILYLAQSFREVFPCMPTSPRRSLQEQIALEKEEGEEDGWRNGKLAKAVGERTGAKKWHTSFCLSPLVIKII